MKYSILFSLVLFWTGSTMAATRFVTNLDNSGPGSLRQAISVAQSGDTIEIQAEGSITLASGLILTRNVTIVGPGADRLTVSGNSASRVFSIAAPVSASISGITITKGFTREKAGGGGVMVEKKATLRMSACEITDCSVNGNGKSESVIATEAEIEAGFDLVAPSGAEARGGGIANYGFLVLKRSTIAGCVARGEDGGYAFETTVPLDRTKPYIEVSGGVGGLGAGGGIFNAGEALLESCTLTGNRAQGGLPGFSQNDGLPGSIADGRIDNNVATNIGQSGKGWGGAIYTSAFKPSVYLTLKNCTVAGNRACGTRYHVDRAPADSGADAGGGIYTAFSSLGLAQNPPSIGGTIMAGNVATANEAQDYRGVLISLGYNLVGRLEGSGGFGGLDLAGTASSPQDPSLSILGHFGGPVRTMALQPDSPAIDLGKSLAGSADQRGFTRRFNFSSINDAINGDGADIGAFELQALLHLDGDADGRADYLIRNNRSVRFLLRKPGGVTTPLSAPNLPAGFSVAAAGKLSASADTGLVLVNSEATRFVVWHLRNGIKISDTVSENLPTGFTSVTLGDFNQDGIEDLIFFNPTTRKTIIRFWNGTKIFGPEKSGPTLRPGSVLLGSGDLNGDRLPDLVVYVAETRKLAYIPMRGTVAGSQTALPNPEANYAPVAVDDFNADGIADLLFYRASNRSTRIFLMNSKGQRSVVDGSPIPSGFQIVKP